MNNIELSPRLASLVEVGHEVDRARPKTVGQALGVALDCLTDWARTAESADSFGAWTVDGVEDVYEISVEALSKSAASSFRYRLRAWLERFGAPGSFGETLTAP